MTSKPEKKIEPQHRDPKRFVYIDEVAQDTNARNLVADLKAGTFPEGTKFVGAGAVRMTLAADGDERGTGKAKVFELLAATLAAEARDAGEPSE